MINVTLLGTGGMLPLPDRWLAALWVEYNGKACLVDCGEGTQIAISEYGIKLSHLDILLITHIHADHISGLAGLLLSLGNCGKTDKLTIYGIKGISDIIAQLLCICPVLPFEVEIKELSDSTVSSFEWNDIEVKSMPLNHSIECLGYNFTLHRKPVFNPEKAKALNIDVKLWSRLHSGENVVSNGETITPSMVISGERKPIKLSYITDTRYFEGIIDFVKNSDLLICEGMYGSDDYIDKMTEKGHMVFSQSADIAVKSDSEILWLTHYSPALSDPSEYEAEIRNIFENTVISSDGEHIVLK